MKSIPIFAMFRKRKWEMGQSIKMCVNLRVYHCTINQVISKHFKRNKHFFKELFSQKIDL